MRKMIDHIRLVTNSQRSKKIGEEQNLKDNTVDVDEDKCCKKNNPGDSNMVPYHSTSLA